MSLHTLRPKHDRNMAKALAAVELADRLRRNGDGVKGFIHVREAIRLVVECGCPRKLWPEKVREVIADG